MNMIKNPKMLKCLRIVITISLVLINIFPIYWMIITSFRAETDILQRPPQLLISLNNLYLRNYQNVFTGYSSGVCVSAGASTFLLNSIIIAASTTILSIIFAYPGAYVVTRIRFPGREFASGLLLICYLIPTIALIVPIFQLSVKLKLINSIVGLIIAESVFNLPIALWVTRGFLSGIPFDIEEAGFVDGCSRFGIMTRITFPIIKPGLSVVATICFTNAWNSYLFPMLFLRREEVKTAPVGLSIYLNEQIGMVWGEMMASGTIIALPVLLIYLFFQKQLIGGIAAGAVKG